MSEDKLNVTRSRKNYLQVLLLLPSQGPVELHLFDTDAPRTAASITAAQPDSSAFLVKDLQTPLGNVSSAIIRGTDIIRLSVKLHDSPS